MKLIKSRWSILAVHRFGRWELQVSAGVDSFSLGVVLHFRYLRFALGLGLVLVSMERMP
jgi:hypothetical protein